MIIIVAFQFMRDVLVEAKELRTVMQKRYPLIGS